MHTPKRGPRSRDTGHGMRWGYGEESKGGGGGGGGGHGPESEARNKGVFFWGGSGAKLGTHVHLIIVPSEWESKSAALYHELLLCLLAPVCVVLVCLSGCSSAPQEVQGRVHMISKPSLPSPS